jgi:putative transposase
VHNDMQTQNLREERGKQIAQAEGQIKRTNGNNFKVCSQSGRGFYEVTITEYGAGCSCPDNQNRAIDCKHIFAVRISLAVRREVEVRKIEPITDSSKCIYCGSEHIVKDGVRHNQSGKIQVFYCKGCQMHFTVNLGFEKMKHNPQAITTAMQLYFSGESFRKTQHSLELLGFKVTHKTVYQWVKKYIGMMEKYLDRITPKVGDTWRTDELYLKVKGDMKYLFAMLDSETRFWIAQQVAQHKGTSDVRPIFKESKEVAQKLPKTFISDGAANFHDAYRKEFLDTFGEKPSPVHIRHIRIAGDNNNDQMEAFNGELRDREKTMRSLKKDDSPVIKGMQVFHNYIRPHIGLNGKTPAEAAGIKVEGENKWLTIIQNATNIAETSSS